MKKLIVFALAVVMALSLAGCCISVTKCDLCGETGFHSKRTSKISGEKYPVCNDCYKEYEFLFK